MIDAGLLRFGNGVFSRMAMIEFGILAGGGSVLAFLGNVRLNGSEYLVGAGLACILYLICRSKPDLFAARRNVTWSIAIWVALLAAPYVLAGPGSYIHLDDEGELVVAQYVMAAVARGQYSHLLGGGADPGAFIVGPEFLSLDRALFEIFPIWVAIALHKVIVTALATIGTYRLCRSECAVSRSLALSLGLLYSVSHVRFLTTTYACGLSWALLPLAIYICVARSNRSASFLPALVFSIFAAAMIVPYQGLFPLVAALAAGAIILRRISMRSIFNCVILLVVIVVNWIESIHAMVQISPASEIGVQATQTGLSIAAELASRIDVIAIAFAGYALAVLLMAAATIFCLLRGDGLWRRIAAVLALPPACYLIYGIIPWDSLGLATARGASSGYFFVAWLVLAPLSFAAACGRCDIATIKRRHWHFALPHCVMVLLMTATIILGGYSARIADEYLSSAGQGMYRIANLREPSWAPNEPFRTVVVSDRKQMITPAPNIVSGVYGLPAFDAWLNLQNRSFVNYWGNIAKREGSWGSAGPLTIRIDRTKTPITPIEIGSKISLPLLAAANVRFVISPILLSDPDLILVDGPAEIPLVYQQQNFRGLSQKFELYMWRLGRLFRPWKVYIYQIRDWRPRIYAAKSIIPAPDSISESDFHQEIGRTFRSRSIVVREAALRPLASAALGGLTDDMFVWREIGDGYDIEFHQAQAGVIVVNALSNAFFDVRLDGAPVEVTAVNGVQMAIAIPSGAKRLSITYRRPTLSARLIGQ